MSAYSCLFIDSLLVEVMPGSSSNQGMQWSSCIHTRIQWESYEATGELDLPSCHLLPISSLSSREK